MARAYIPRMVNLEAVDYHIVRGCADDKGLGEKGFSAALRLIIRDWQVLNEARDRMLIPDPEQDEAQAA